MSEFIAIVGSLSVIVFGLGYAKFNKKERITLCLVGVMMMVGYYMIFT